MGHHSQHHSQPVAVVVVVVEDSQAGLGELADTFDPVADNRVLVQHQCL